MEPQPSSKDFKSAKCEGGSEEVEVVDLVEDSQDEQKDKKDDDEESVDVPIYNVTIDDVDESLSNFIEIFKRKTKKTPKFVIKCPGRVNLMGDHIDYHGFGVLPMAIDKYLYMGVTFEHNSAKSATNGYVRLSNNHKTTFPDFTFQHSFQHVFPKLGDDPQWYQYFLCGYFGVLATHVLGTPCENVLKQAELFERDPQQCPPNSTLTGLPSMTVFIDSDIPPESGLSSSSALVCASAVVTLLALQYSDYQTFRRLPLDSATNIAHMCSKFERLIGTNGGGMDQAVIMTARKGYAKYVEFEPKLKCTDIKLPEHLKWIVTSMGEYHKKSATDKFNQRVTESKIATAYLANKMNLPVILDNNITMYQVTNMLKTRNIQTAVILRIQMIDSYRVTLRQLMYEFRWPEYQVRAAFNIKGKLYPANLYARLMHIVTESDRVLKFKTALQENHIDKLGPLMNQSHESLSAYCQVSTQDLNDLCEYTLKSCKALGSRLTGAGFGGSIITLADDTSKVDLLKALKDEAVYSFFTQPQDGCVIYKFKQQ